MGGFGDLEECVQTPIVRRFAPNVCLALSPPGACSQANRSEGQRGVLGASFRAEELSEIVGYSNMADYTFS